MQRETNLQGYIVKIQDLSEADLLLTFFSLDLGKIRFVAKSAKKMASKLRGRLQPNCLVEITLTGKSSLPLVIGSELIHSYPDIIDSQDKIQAVQVMQEIILRALPDELPNPDLFNSFTGALQNLNSHDSSSSLLVLIKFLVDSLISLGFTPELLPDITDLPAQIFYNLEEGRFKNRFVSSNDQIISIEAYLLLIDLQKDQLRNYLETEASKELFKALVSFLTYRLERELKAADYFLHQLA